MQAATSRVCARWTVVAVVTLAIVGATATPLAASTDSWAAAWCSAGNRFDDAYDKADELGNKLYGSAMSGSGGIAASKRKLAAAAVAARKAANEAVKDLTAAGAPDEPGGAALQTSALAAFNAAARALKQAVAKLEGFDPSDPKGTIKALRSSGGRGAAGRAASALEDFREELDDALADNPALEQALAAAGCR